MKNRQDHEAAELTRVEQLLNAAAADQEFLSEPPHDLVARALRRATPVARPRPAVARWGFGAFGSLAAVCASIAFGAIQITHHLALRPQPLPTPVIAEAVPTPEIASTTTLEPPTSEFAPVLSPPRPLLAHFEPRRRHRWHLSRRPVSPLKVAVRTDPAQTVAAPRPRPFWHDEEVERDDFVGYAPALVAEGTGGDLAAVTPALVQVSFSTTHPIARATSADYETDR